MKIETQPLAKVSYTVKETAKIMSTSVDTIYTLIERGHLRAMKLPTMSIPAFEIDRFMRDTLEADVDYSDLIKQKKAEREQANEVESNLVQMQRSYRTK